MRTPRLYLRLLGAHFRSMLEYEADFVILALATVLMQVVNIVFLAALFAKVPDVHGWTFWSVLIMFGAVALAEGFCSLFFDGMWSLAWQINRGDLDYFLVRPYPVALQSSSANVGINGLSNIVMGGIMIGTGLAHADIPWTPWRALLGVILLISSVVIKLSINLATNAVSFWLSSPTPMFAFAMHQVGDLARFPLSVYPVALKAVLGAVLPFAFISFFPTAYLLDTGQSRWLGLITPLVAAYCAGAAALVFKRGLRRYESAGN
ncbi:ABC transporter permease [Actinoplanes sp. NBRC 14428]|uniref:ABC-2 type transport system permease protein n=1 Tax=Pseudosporangium ferrugineum TaxID=439699 RepID=A0A2T0RQN7_9ACTN|nr:ABC-2 family transporter protein [Pseudosporangium ferrugineum]PRY23403.1 ABC-2 type transport system permease protein [Pseudosporangium ferrugineum]BCJ55399.1 ABC transporter permease [Actinoplanes sp. NBRC 14428]